MGYRDDDTTEFVSDQEKKAAAASRCARPRWAGERRCCREIFPALPEGGGPDTDAAAQRQNLYGGGAQSAAAFVPALGHAGGIRAMRGRDYATLRTVPSGGARHAFETYLVVRYVEGLRPGAYHYLPMEHALEFLHPVEQLEDRRSDTPAARAGRQRPA